MSFFDYEFAKRFGGQDVPFPALIMAALRRADPENRARLQEAFPAVWQELQARDAAPAGALTADELVIVYRRIDAQRQADQAAGVTDGYYPATAGLFAYPAGNSEAPLSISKAGG